MLWNFRKFLLDAEPSGDGGGGANPQSQATPSPTPATNSIQELIEKIKASDAKNDSLRHDHDALLNKVKGMEDGGIAETVRGLISGNPNPNPNPSSPIPSTTTPSTEGPGAPTGQEKSDKPRFFPFGAVRWGLKKIFSK